MEDICSKLQEIRNPIHAIGLVIREMDYETEVEMEKGFNPGKWQNNKRAFFIWFRENSNPFNFFFLNYSSAFEYSNESFPALW